MKKAIIGAAVSLAFAGAAMAQTQAQNPATNPGSQKVAPPLQFNVLDTNKDGRVSKDEVRTHVDLTSSFATLDSDKDSYLSESEYGKWQPASPPMKSPGAERTPSDTTPPVLSK